MNQIRDMMEDSANKFIEAKLKTPRGLQFHRSKTRRQDYLNGGRNLKKKSKY